MESDDQAQSSCGGDAPVMVYAAENVITLPADATLAAVAKELADDEIGIVVIGTRGDATGVLSERDVAELMMEHYVRHVLLEDDGHLVAIVSARDLLGAYTMAQD